MAENDRNVTGEEFRQLLKRLGWSQTVAATRLGLHRNTLVNWVSDGPPQWAVMHIQLLLEVRALYDRYLAPVKPTRKK